MGSNFQRPKFNRNYYKINKSKFVHYFAWHWNEIEKFFEEIMGIQFLDLHGLGLG